MLTLNRDGFLQYLCLALVTKMLERYNCNPSNLSLRLIDPAIVRRVP